MAEVPVETTLEPPRPEDQHRLRKKPGVDHREEQENGKRYGVCTVGLVTDVVDQQDVQDKVRPCEQRLVDYCPRSFPGVAENQL